MLCPLCIVSSFGALCSELQSILCQISMHKTTNNFCYIWRVCVLNDVSSLHCVLLWGTLECIRRQILLFCHQNISIEHHQKVLIHLVCLCPIWCVLSVFGPPLGL